MHTHLSVPAKPSRASKAHNAKAQTLPDAGAVYNLLKPRIENEVVEHSWAVYVDTQGKLLEVNEISRGSTDHVESDIREIFRNAIDLAAYNVILVHSHPSSNRDPSAGDCNMTRMAVIAGQIIGIPVVDHLIINRDGFTRLSEVKPRIFAPPDVSSPSSLEGLMRKIMESDFQNPHGEPEE
jgi:DNA repair protein RadC